MSSLDESPLYVPDGSNLVTGAQAAGFATFTVPGAPESERIARMNQVLTTMFQTLPLDEKRLTETLESLGAMAGTNVPTADVVNMLIELSESKAWAFPAARTLPTSASDLEQVVTTTWLRIERSQTAPLGDAMEVSGFQKVSDQIAVMVTGGLAEDRLRIRNQLDEGGFDFIDGGNPGLATTTQFTASNTLKEKDIEGIFSVLGMDALWVSRLNETDNPVADLVVTLGSDFIVPVSN